MDKHERKQEIIRTAVGMIKQINLDLDKNELALDEVINLLELFIYIVIEEYNEEDKYE